MPLAGTTLSRATSGRRRLYGTVSDTLRVNEADFSVHRLPNGNHWQKHILDGHLAHGEGPNDACWNIRRYRKHEDCPGCPRQGWSNEAIHSYDAVRLQEEGESNPSRQTCAGIS